MTGRVERRLYYREGRARGESFSNAFRPFTLRLLHSTAAPSFNSACPAAAHISFPTFRVTRLARSLARAAAEPAHTLAARFGDMALPDVLIALTACEQRGDHSRTRGAGYVEPPRAAR